MKHSPPKPWQRATRARPCPVCHAAGCLYAGSHGDPIAVVCANVTSAKPIGTAGHLHVLRDAGGVWAPWRTSLKRLAMRPERN
jgi:hypothetical protein